ncbi:hypothetical protein [Companilactobacillus sp.]|uniref:hypothetical protein n=1 Tax=Companilactobacillus sp. TaxID=2767905 RepID=UPI002617D8FC|nr:hypothetical protein [Companilactobacillus sp.]
MEEKLLFYDIEVFAQDNFAVFMDENKDVVKVFHNDYSGCMDLIKGRKLIGYNNHYYDDRILPKMMGGQTPVQIKELNDKIIGGDREIGRNTMLKGTYDCFQQIDVSFPSLKKIEGNRGKMILESDVPFDLDRELTEKEIEEVIFYCTYDVKNTVDIFGMREFNYFKTKQHLIDMVQDPPKTIEDWNTTTIAANVLLDKPLTKWSDIRLGEYQADGEYELLNLVPTEVKELWLTKNKGSFTIQDFGCDVTFGFGGLHGSHRTIHKFKDVVLWDVTSMYPHIILLLNVLVGASDKYKQILEDRIVLKKTNPDLAGAYKLVLNSVYGNLRNKYSLLNNPEAAKSVCLYGQIALYTLCKMLAPYATLVNINTDGIGFIPNTDMKTLDTIKDEWQKRFNLSLEQDSFDLFIQKDVNNYIGWKDTDNDGKPVKGSGHLKVKGPDVGCYQSDANFRTNSTRIVDIAVVNKLLYSEDVIDTLTDNLNKPYLYQYILQAGNTFKGTFDETGNQYQKINRVFATKQNGIKLYKKRQDNGMVKFPDAPEEMFIWNDDTSKLKNFPAVVDLNFYYQLINKILERWEV